MPSTTNFNWTTPADTDLVKDGAAAIRTLANGIDTSLVDLKGGTTGQILSKNSNTDLDYTWINNDQGDITNVGVTAPITGGGASGSVTIGIDDASTTQKGAVQLEDSTSSTSTTKAATPNSVKSAYDLANAAIPKSLVDAAGDLIYATADNTVARLALGTAGQVLKVNSGATAPEWGAAAAASGLTLIKTQTIGSGVADVTVTGAFDSTYDNYKIVVAGGAGSGGEALNMQLGTTTSGYSNNAISMSFNSTTVTGLNYDNHSAWVAVGRFSTNIIHCDVDVYAPNLAKTTLMRANGSGSAAGASGVNYIGFGFVNNTTQYTSFKLLSAGASTMTGGTIFVYGYAK